MKTKPKILFLDDNLDDIELVQRALKKDGINYIAKVVQDSEQYTQALTSFSPDIILSDYSLPSLNGIFAFEIKKIIAPLIPFIIISGTIGEENAVELIKQGVTDYVSKDKLFLLPVKIVRALKEKDDKRKKNEAEDELLKSMMSYKSLLDNMNDGFMVDNVAGKVVFANDRYCEIFGIDKSDLPNLVLEDYVAPEYHQVLRDRHNRRVDGEDVPDIFEYLGLRKDGTNIWLEVHVKAIIENGLITGTQSVIQDITERKLTEKKIAHVNRLYAFISQINQAIVHIKDPKIIFREACRIAIEYGKFKIAWIGNISQTGTKIELVEQYGIPVEDITLFLSNYQFDSTQDKVVKDNKHYIYNDIEKEFEKGKWKEYALSRDIRSCMVLPIRMSDRVVGTLNIYASETGFFDQDEIALLEEAAGDISFAIDVYEKENQRILAERQLQKTYDDVRSLLDNTDEMFLTVGKGLEVVSFNKKAGDGCRKYLGKELTIGSSILDYTSPDRVELLRNLYEEVLAGERRQTEGVFEANGEKAYFRTLMKPILNVNGETEGVFVIEQNITELINNREQIEFDQHNLNALINNTRDLLWSVDTHYRLITANSSFVEAVLQMAGEKIDKGDNVLSPAFSKDRLEKFKQYYDRAFSGESFTEVEYNPPPYESWSAISFNPIQQDGEIIGTACNAHDITESKLTEEKLVHANRMYAFTSQINQTIVHVTDELTLFNEACRIAVTVGKFELACIDHFDEENRELNLIAQCNADPANVGLFSSLPFSENGAIATMLLQAKCYVINDYDKEPEQDFWSKYAFFREFKSAIVLPINKMGKTQYVLSLFSKKTNIFDDAEISLLMEAAGDISFAIDVLEKELQRKQIEDRLRHSEARLKQAQKVSQLGSWELDFSTGIATWSEESCRIYGLDPQDSIQSYQKWLSFIHPDDLDDVLSITKTGQETLSSTAMHHRIIRTDGAVRYIYSQSYFEFNAIGAPIGLYGVAHDITDIKEAEEAMQQSKENLRLIVDLIPQSIFAMDENGMFVFVNRSFAELYGVAPKDLVYKSIYDTIPDKGAAEGFVEQAREVIYTGVTKTIPELTFTTYSGEKRVFFSVKVPYELAGKKTRAMLGISLDITEQKKAEAERSLMIADIVQRNKDLEQFSYIVSHNLRAPVANIIGLSELLQILEHNEDEERTLMENLSQSVKKLDSVIKDLNYVLQVKHQVNEKKELVSLSEMCMDIQTSIDNLLHSEDVQIISDFSAVNEMHTLKSYLYSIFFNLISNSIKYHQPGHPPVIKITSRKEDGKIELVFEDNGLGIDLAQRGNQVFGLYKRFHYHTDGKGMGLYMVKTQVETLGGKISIESEVKKGTIFKISFDDI